MTLRISPVEELARLVETNGIDATKEVAKANVVLAKRESAAGLAPVGFNRGQPAVAKVTVVLQTDSIQ